jgi:molecular chaperone GrpE
MGYPQNGRTIRIPVQKVSRQLPTTEERPRALLTRDVSCEDVVTKVRDQVKAEIETEVADWKERALRLQADAENARRRVERRAEAQIKQERRRLLTRLLVVADNLERALAHTNEDGALYDGVQLTFKDLMERLTQEGVKQIQALGRPFDPNLHEAVATDDSGGGVVIKVVQTGYTLDGELLRAARVVVGDPA